jgi:hypothetical protein
LRPKRPPIPSPRRSMASARGFRGAISADARRAA